MLHILLNTRETGTLYEFDKSSIDEVKTEIIRPYLLNEEFYFDGFFIEPSKVKRLLISESKISSQQCVELAYKQLPEGVFIPINASDCVFGDDGYAKDISREVLASVKQEIGTQSSSSEQSLGLKEVSPSQNGKTIFLGYSYRAVDDEFVSGFKDLLIDKGFKVLDGKADGLGSISQAIIEKIQLSDAIIIVMTKRDKKENGKFTTSAWLLEEKGAGIALGKHVGMLVEQEVDDSEIGGIQGDNQRYYFTRNNFTSVGLNVIKALNKTLNEQIDKNYKS